MPEFPWQTLGLLLMGVLGGGLFLFALWKFFQTESEWHRGGMLWIGIAFIGFLLLAFVLVAKLTGGSFLLAGPA